MRRRSFLRVAGATAATSALVLAGCDDTEPTVQSPFLNVGKGDGGVFNYFLLLEQLEAAFYQKVVDAPPADFIAGDLAYFTDLRDHEVIHREFFNHVLGANRFGTMEFDFSSVNFTSRSSVLAAAKTIEDIGVAAYNGAISLLVQPVYLALLAKIASVEARHAALVRDLAQPSLVQSTAFAGADVVEATGTFAGLERALTPTQVIAATAQFYKIPVIVSDLPTS
ncbi:ferritin-like domain-containing protein [Hymenobacter translucens]|uniref:ferritin-like domain-containing protein n=1 Tax=Hymenobacter translucens TaxID=2886507 RepID=UPI001D0EF5F9|nr:ferritin-like domain-containing protein [Hymenobacter translucens]